MAPWEELRYFARPQSGYLPSSSQPGTQIVPADSMRAVLIISVGNGSGFAGNLYIALAPSATNAGISLSGNVPLILTARDHPGLCQAAWYIGQGLTANAYWVTVSFLRWPDDTPPSDLRQIQDWARANAMRDRHTAVAQAATELQRVLDGRGNHAAE